MATAAKVAGLQAKAQNALKTTDRNTKRRLRNLQGVADEIEGFINEEVRKSADALIDYLAINTPIDTGEAKGEWQVTLNKRATSKTYRLDTNGAQMARIEKANIAKAEKIKWPTIYVSNLAEHIQKLNNGSSDQAPAKFVEMGIEVATNVR